MLWGVRMSKFEDAFSLASGMNGNGATASFAEDHFPELSAALAGVWSAEKSKWERKPASLTVWIDGRHVKVCLGIDDSCPKWFWSTDSLECLTELLEKALTEGKGNWWNPSERKRR